VIESVDEYLALLKEELDASDPATIQDALSDAEEHLRTALDNELELQAGLSESEALPPIIAKYGTPIEIAMAYKEIETRIRPALAQRAGDDKRSTISRFFSVISEPTAWGALLYMFFSLISGVIYFTWAVTGLSLSLGLLILIIGMPFLVFFLLSVRTIALVEGRVIEALLGVRMPRRSLFAPSRVGWWERLKSLFLERRTWGGIAYLLLLLPLGILYFTIFAILLAFSLGFILAPVIELGFHTPLFTINNTAYFTPVWLLPLVVIAGFIIFFTTMHLAKLIGRIHGALAKSLLLGI
jgi:uncharacterized membrane protein